MKSFNSATNPVLTLFGEFSGLLFVSLYYAELGDNILILKQLRPWYTKNNTNKVVIHSSFMDKKKLAEEQYTVFEHYNTTQLMFTWVF